MPLVRSNSTRKVTYRPMPPTTDRLHELILEPGCFHCDKVGRGLTPTKIGNLIGDHQSSTHKIGEGIFAIWDVDSYTGVQCFVITESPVEMTKFSKAVRKFATWMVEQGYTDDPDATWGEFMAYPVLHVSKISGKVINGRVKPTPRRLPKIK